MNAVLPASEPGASWSVTSSTLPAGPASVVSDRGGDMTVLTEWIWLIWLGLAIVFVVVEIFTVDLIFAMLAIGSLVGGMLTALLGGAWWLQIVLAAVIALLLVFTLRPPLLRRIRGHGSTVRQNVHAIPGLTGVIATVADDGSGTVKLANGETWTARGIGETAILPDERVLVVRVVGATVEVEPDLQ